MSASTSQMFTQVLHTQWKWARWLLLAGTIAGFALPLLSVQGAGGGSREWQARMLLSQMTSWSPLYVILAALLGLLLGVSAWTADHRGRHIYALSLPVTRARFAMLRWASGAVLLLLPALALWGGAILACVATRLPPGITAYPGSLAGRFALAALVAYALFFLVSAGTTRTAGLVLGVLAAILAAEFLVTYFTGETKLIKTIGEALFYWPGPFEVFTGRWMLFDV